DARALSVTGSASGLHAGTLTLSDDARTLVFVPAVPFALGERVRVELEPGPVTANHERLPPLAFEFSVSTLDPSLQPASTSAEEELEDLQPPIPPGLGAAKTPASPLAGFRPPNYPPVWVFNSKNPEPGAVFMTPSSPSEGNLLIVDNFGQPLFYRRS